jgi:hypothetical protein
LASEIGLRNLRLGMDTDIRPEPMLAGEVNHGEAQTNGFGAPLFLKIRPTSPRELKDLRAQWRRVSHLSVTTSCLNTLGAWQDDFEIRGVR